MKASRLLWYGGTIFMTFAVLAASATVVAQTPGPLYARSATATDSSKLERQRHSNVKAFRAIAAKLNTTPAALQVAFERAREGNPRLSRGNFVAANVLADNLGARRPNVTTAAILSGLQRGMSLGQTLQSLGLTAKESKHARRASDLRVKDGLERVRDEDRRSRAREVERRQREREDAGRNR